MNQYWRVCEQEWKRLGVVRRGYGMHERSKYHKSKCVEYNKDGVEERGLVVRRRRLSIAEKKKMGGKGYSIGPSKSNEST